MLKALSGEMHWFRAADILGWSPRTLRRWRQRYETPRSSKRAGTGNGPECLRSVRLKSTLRNPFIIVEAR